MTTTPAQARETAEKYVARERPGARVSGLLQDDEDYLVTLEMVTAPEFPVGWAFIFINKATGTLWTAAPGLGVDKMLGMA